MELLTPELRAVLIANGAVAASDPAFNPHPVVKLFTPDAGGTWLIAWAEEDGADLILWGLCDLGVGCPELGPVMLSELLELRGHLRLAVERDLFFVADRPLSRYASEARHRGAISA